jgi:hypothetical protein
MLSLFVAAQHDTQRSLAFLQGYPDWKTFQNRMLGPYLVWAASKVTGLTFAQCHLFFVLGFLYLSNLLSFRLLGRVIQNIHAVYALTLLNAAALVAVNHGEHYDFDLIDFNTMFVFAYAVFFEMPLWGLALLFGVELLNRESAEFIALWMVLDGLISIGRKHERSDWIKVITGAVLLVAGAAWTQFIRDRLFKGDRGEEHIQRVLGQHIQVLQNLHDILLPSVTADTLMILLVILYVRFARCAFVSLTLTIKVGFLLAAFVSSLFLFAVISEIRVWFEIVPFMVLMYAIPLRLAKGYR